MTTVLFAGTLTYNDIDILIKTKLENKVQVDFPMINREDIKIDVLNKEAVSSFHTDAVDFTYTIPEKSNVVGRTVLPLKLLNANGEIVQTKQVLAEVKAYTTFYKSNRLVKRGSVLSASDLTAVKLNLGQHSKRQILVKEDLVGKEVKSSLAPDTILGSWMVRDVPDIKQGSMVTLVFSENGLLLKAKGRALDDGFIGKFIRVQSSYKANKIIIGEVLNETNVKVSLIN
jgi:flagellar basal body P-ring formation protein FlgA